MASGKVFIIHHGTENYPAISSDIATPILGGSEKDIGDFGKRISQRETSGKTYCEKHETWSEFTVYAWIYLNISWEETLDYIGIFHYRSFLYLKDGTGEGDFLQRMGITEKCIKEQLQDCDAIITNVDDEDFYKHWNNTTIYKQFDSCHSLARDLFDSAYSSLEGLEKVNDFYSGITNFAKDYFEKPKHRPYFKSVFVSKQDYFERYMNFMLNMLIWTEQDVQDKIKKLPAEKRYRLLAFFGERLTALFIAFTAKKKEYFKIKEVKRYHEENLQKFLKDVYPYKTINGIKAIPLIRLYCDSRRSHTYIPVDNTNGKNLPTFDNLTKQKFWVDGLCGYLLATQDKNTLPVYMLQEPIGGDYFYTNDKNEYEQAKQISKYTNDFGCIGYILTQQTQGSRPLLRYLVNTNELTRHFYTTDPNEYKNFENLFNTKCVSEGNIGYIIM